MLHNGAHGPHSYCGWYCSSVARADKGAVERFASMMAPTSVTTQRVVPTDAATIVAVEAEEALPSVNGNPPSRAAQAAIRPYKQAGGDGPVSNWCLS